MGELEMSEGEFAELQKKRNHLVIAIGGAMPRTEAEGMRART
jgi:hypothetical protein